ncbi:MAG: hypothetical protein HYX61_11925 [Gammaproteobacteria bacterium]|jgi:predicted  nucleic acid-binding Zn-ribbon protein|nr:hypothetical protein [Gammaproteobacteria bacterium]
MPRSRGDAANADKDTKVVITKHDEPPKHSLLGSVTGFLKDAPGKYTPEVVKRIAGSIYDAAPSRKIVVPVVGTAAMLTGGVVGVSYFGGIDVVSLLNYLRPTTLAALLPAMPAFSELLAMVSPYALPATSLVAGGYGVNRIRNLSKQNAELVAALNVAKLVQDNSLDARQAELDELEENLESAQADVNETKKALSKEKRALNKEKKAVTAEQAALAEQRDELAEQEKQQQATAKHQQSKQKQLNAKEAELADKARALSDKEDELRELEEELDAGEGQLKEAQEALEEAKREFEAQRARLVEPKPVEEVASQGAPILTGFSQLRAQASINVPKPTANLGKVEEELSSHSADEEEHSHSNEEKAVPRTPSRSPSPLRH